MDNSQPASAAERPEWRDNYRDITSGCGVADLSSRSRVWITGADRVQFLHGFCTGDIKRLQPGEGCEAFLTNHQGKTVGHVLVRDQAGNALVLDTAPNQATTIIQHLERFVIADRVEFQDQTAATSELLLAGNDARRLLSAVTQNSLPTNLYQHALTPIQGRNVIVQKVDYAGEGSFFLTTRSEDLSAIRQVLVSAGAIPGTFEAIEALRIQAGFPLFGSDITDENLPQEIGRDQQAISFTKGCYLGQETVARIDALGHVNRRLARVRFNSAEIPTPGTELFSDEKPVGHVTSACWSPEFDSPLAFALLRRIHAVSGRQLHSSLGLAEVC